jgi:hypothetical protein
MQKGFTGKTTHGDRRNAACVVKLDRLVFVSPRIGRQAIRTLPSIPGFKITRDTIVRKRAKIATYRRVRAMENSATGTKLYVQYSRAHGWLKPIRVTVVGNDATGILWPDLKNIGDAFGDILIRTIELAFDFEPASGVDREFVLKHALFGKSRPTRNEKYPELLRYGTRHSSKMVRCYQKPEVNAFRVELELHRDWRGLPQTDCLLFAIPLGQKDLRFIDVNWRALDSHLATKGPRGKRLCACARRHYTSIHALLRYLRAAGVNNPHRFLRLSQKDTEIRKALDVWCDSLSPQQRNKRTTDEQNQN